MHILRYFNGPGTIGKILKMIIRDHRKYSKSTSSEKCIVLMERYVNADLENITFHEMNYIVSMKE